MEYCNQQLLCCCAHSQRKDRWEECCSPEQRQQQQQPLVVAGVACLAYAALASAVPGPQPESRVAGQPGTQGRCCRLLLLPQEQLQGQLTALLQPQQAVPLHFLRMTGMTKI